MFPLLSVVLLAQAGGAAPLPPAGYHVPDEIPGILESTAGSGAITTLATTPGGRPMQLVSFGPMDVGGRPEILVVANCEGDRLVATETALGLIAHFGAGSPLLDVATVHVLALANPDASAAVHAGQDPWRGSPVDDDRDGMTDEDGPDDLDGDGLALWMRVPRVGGTHFSDPTDPRSSRKADAKKGEAGAFVLMREGADDDGDRIDQEDGIGGVRWDSNWPHRHQLHAANSGDYQLSEVETKALADFVLARTNLALVIVLDDEDNLADVPSGTDRTDKNSTEPLKEDVPLLKLLAERLESEELPTPRSADHGRGNFADWVYFQRGILVLESSVWSMPTDFKPETTEETDEGEEEEIDAPELDTDELRMLAWADQTYGAAAFSPWKVVPHPRYGSVEVGGWMPLLEHNPPAEVLPALQAHWVGFLDSLAADLPRIEWSDFEIEDLGGGVLDVRATLSNTSLMPTAAAMAGVTRRMTPVRVRLELPEGGELLSGRVAHSVESLDGLGGNQSFRWLLRVPASSSPAQVRALSRAAGEAVLSLEAN